MVCHRFQKMLSIGIQFGKGFDRENIAKLMQSAVEDDIYDLLVIGSSPGGVACAREAGAAGRKTALIKWKNYSPAEKEGFDEDLEKMGEVLEVNKLGVEMGSAWEDTTENSEDKDWKSKSTLPKSSIVAPDLHASSRTSKTHKWSRKVRQSRLDLKNELFKRGHQGRKLMHNAVILRDAVKDAQNCGWKTGFIIEPLTMNWDKMMKLVMGYVMKENYELMNALIQGGVEVFEGVASFIDSHTVQLIQSDRIRHIKAEIICIAPSAHYSFPPDVVGAKDFGITCDDFIRISEPPGETLVVGSTPEGLECAGIMACCRYPVTVVSRSRILKNHDKEISELIAEDLKKRGVVFKENTALTSIELGKTGKLVAKFVSSIQQDEEEGEEHTNRLIYTSQSFDTVLFATGTKISLEFLNLDKVGIELDALSQKINTDEQECALVSNIYAIGDIVGDRPHNFETDQLAGTLLGRRLFHNVNENLEYSMIPSVIFTPTQYAFVGISEDTAIYRFGQECIEIHHGSFVPLDFVLPPRNTKCFAKMIVFRPSDLVIGLHLFGPEAGEIIQGFSVLVKFGVTVSKLRTVIGVHATKARELLRLKEVKTFKEDEGLGHV